MAASAHVDPDTVPAVTLCSNNLESSFVSLNAEDSYQYKPSAANKPMTTSRLLNKLETLLSVSPFIVKTLGVTNERGEFEYLWGDDLQFGIDTLELGASKGNKMIT